MSIGFGLERIGLAALAWPRIAAVVALAVVAVTFYGITHIAFDDSLRDFFSADTQEYRNYTTASAAFVDPGNETIVLIEGNDLASPEAVQRLSDFHFELMLLPDVADVSSVFSLRAAPVGGERPAALIEDPSAGLTPALREAIRSHPMLGNKMLSEHAAAYVVTPAERRATLDEHRALHDEIREIAGRVLAGSDLTMTLTGFPALLMGIVDRLSSDQVWLNGASMMIGIVISLILFRSLIGALVTAVPATLSAIVLIGGMGALGLQVSVLSIVVPVLVMIIGYSDAMHLTYAWRRARDRGEDVAAAARAAMVEVGPACVLAALTTVVAFLSLTFSDIGSVRQFGLVGAIGTLVGLAVVLFLHPLMALALGRFWTGRGDATGNLLQRMERPSVAIARFATRRGWIISILSLVAFFVLGYCYYSLQPNHSLRAYLPANDPASLAFERADRDLGGVLPVLAIVPLDHPEQPSEAELTRLGELHRAAAGADGVTASLSLWSLIEWQGGTVDARTTATVASLLADMNPSQRRRFISDSGAVVTLYLHEEPAAVTERRINDIEARTRAVFPEVIITGNSVVNARSGAAAIGNLNLNLFLALLSGLAVLALAFRGLAAPLAAALPNALPLLATGALMYVLGWDLQITSVISLTVACGVAIDNTVHYLNRFVATPGGSIGERMTEAARGVGPVLIGTTLIIITGLASTTASELPTLHLFGLLATITLASAMVGDILILPAIIAGPMRKWFKTKQIRGDRPDPTLEARRAGSQRSP